MDALNQFAAQYDAIAMTMIFGTPDYFGMQIPSVLCRISIIGSVRLGG